MMDKLAENIRLLRLKRGLSQDQLATLSNVTRSSISAMEREDTNPSFRSVIRVSQALGVTLEELMSNPVGSGAQHYSSQEMNVEKHKHGQIHKVDLLPQNIPGLQFEKLLFRQQVSLEGVPHLKGTWEYCTCTKGELVISVDGEEFSLKQGDVLSFPGHKKHSYRNPNHAEAQAISVIVLEK